LDGTVDNETEDEAGPEDDVATDEEDSEPQDGDNTDAAMQSAPLDLKRPQPDHCTERLSSRDSDGRDRTIHETDATGRGEEKRTETRGRSPHADDSVTASHKELQNDNSIVSDHTSSKIPSFSKSKRKASLGFESPGAKRRSSSTSTYADGEAGRTSLSWVPVPGWNLIKAGVPTRSLHYWKVDDQTLSADGLQVERMR